MSKKNDGMPKQTFGENISALFGKLKALVKDVIAHWNIAPEGKSLPYKEWAAYCVGGMGVSAATVLPTYLTLGLGIYIAAALNFKASTIAVVAVITSIVTIVKSPIIGMIIDNTKSKYGKFRPYIMWMPIPAFLCIVLIGWVPYLIVDNYIAMVVVFTVLYNLMQIFLGIYTLAFNSLIQVISPSPEERTNLMSVGAFVYSLGPSIVSFLLPLISEVFSVGSGDDKISGLNMIGTYQWILPAMALVFFAIGYWTAFGTKERTVVSKKYVQKVKFFAGIKQTASNKYFWITVISTVFSVFKLLCTSFTTLICIYMIQQNVALSIANVLLGMAYIPGMLLAPLLIKKFGKKNLVIATNFGVAAVSGLMIMILLLPYGGATPYLLMLCSFFAIVSNSVQVVTGPAMVAQYYDYQQFKTGNRLEGFLSQFSAMITSFFAIFTGLIGPAIGAAVGYADDAKVFFNIEILEKYMLYNIILGAGCAILCTLPYFFWDLTEKKHRQIMDVLAVRAKEEDGLIDKEAEQILEERILAGETDVIKSFFHKSEDELLAEAGGNTAGQTAGIISGEEQIIEPITSPDQYEIDTPNGGIGSEFEAVDESDSGEKHDE